MRLGVMLCTVHCVVTVSMGLCCLCADRSVGSVSICGVFDQETQVLLPARVRCSDDGTTHCCVSLSLCPFVSVSLCPPVYLSLSLSLNTSLSLCLLFFFGLRLEFLLLFVSRYLCPISSSSHCVSLHPPPNTHTPAGWYGVWWSCAAYQHQRQGAAGAYVQAGAVFLPAPAPHHLRSRLHAKAGQNAFSLCPQSPCSSLIHPPLSPQKRFFANFGSIVLYAVLGTVISTFVIGMGLFELAKSGVVPLDGDNPLQALLFGALISAVDPVATLSIMGSPELNCDKLLYSLVFGESVLNDAVAIVLFKYASLCAHVCLCPCV